MKNLPVYGTEQSVSEYKRQYLFESVGSASIVKVVEYSFIDFAWILFMFIDGFHKH